MTIRHGTRLYVTKWALAGGIREHVFDAELDSAEDTGEQARYVYVRLERGYRTQLIRGQDVFTTKAAAVHDVLKKIGARRAAWKRQEAKWAKLEKELLGL